MGKIKKKDKMLTVLCERDLYKVFFDAVKDNDKHISQVIREFMKTYIIMGENWNVHKTSK